jgi:hypothetical protein
MNKNWVLTILVTGITTLLFLNNIAAGFNTITVRSTSPVISQNNISYLSPADNNSNIHVLLADVNTDGDEIQQQEDADDDGYLFCELKLLRLDAYVLLQYHYYTQVLHPFISQLIYPP